MRKVGIRKRGGRGRGKSKVETVSRVVVGTKKKGRPQKLWIRRQNMFVVEKKHKKGV